MLSRRAPRHAGLMLIAAAGLALTSVRAGAQTLSNMDLGGFAFGPIARGDQLFFISQPVPATNLTMTLWVSDATPEGTHQVAPQPVVVEQITPAASRIYFTALTTATGRELWTSDGTAAGTHIVRDIRPGGSNTSNPPISLVTLGDRCIFQARNTANALRYWVTDGTDAGTSMLSCLPVSTDLIYHVPARLGGALLFAASDAAHGTELWTSDGITASLLKDINPTGSSSPDNPPPLGGGFAVRRLAATGDHVFFVANDGSHGTELWSSDGTEQGTSMVVDLTPGPNGTYIAGIVCGPTRCYFNVRTPEFQLQLWTTDGTAAGTIFLADVSTEYIPMLVNTVGDDAYLATSRLHSGTDIWTSDGTPVGTRIIAHAGGDVGRELPRAFVGEAGGGRVFFDLDDFVHGRELWVTDGTESGTHIVADLNPGEAASDPYGMTVKDNTLYFTATVPDPAIGSRRDLWSLSPATPPCRADFNGDGLVFPDDLSEYITCFFQEVQSPGSCGRADFNGDGLAFPDDLSEYITAFFQAAQFGC